MCQRYRGQREEEYVIRWGTGFRVLHMTTKEWMQANEANSLSVLSITVLMQEMADMHEKKIISIHTLDTLTRCR